MQQYTWFYGMQRVGDYNKHAKGDVTKGRFIILRVTVYIQNRAKWDYLYIFTVMFIKHADTLCVSDCLIRLTLWSTNIVDGKFCALCYIEEE